MAKKKPQHPPLIAIFGDEEFQKSRALTERLDQLLPPEVDRAMALCDYDGTKSAEQGGPSLASVMDDLATLPFLSDRRVVIIRDADSFISEYRDKLENYAKSPAPTATLILCCRSFPKSTKLYKAAIASGGVAVECKKLNPRGLAEFVTEQATAHGKRLDRGVAARLVDLVGQDQGLLSGEVEKLCLYALDRKSVTGDDLSDLVGQTREEKIFAVMDAAANGDLCSALRLWHNVIATDPSAVFKALGGIAFKLRQWITAHDMAASGTPINQIAPRVMMWGRIEELQQLLRRVSADRLKRLLAGIAALDAKAKSGTRSIDTGIEAFLLRLAS